MKLLPVARISLIVNRAMGCIARETLNRYKLPLISIQACRSVRLGKAPFLGIGRSRLEESPSEMLRIWVQPGQEEKLMSDLCHATGIGKPGGGCIFSEQISLMHHSLESLPPAVAGAVIQGGAMPVPLRRFDPLTGVVCIVQRGQGNEVARLALDMGLSAPMVGFGVGMGLRNRLGLIRITIPAGKEIVLFLCSPHDAPEAVAFLRDALGLARAPGKAFIYAFPSGSGLADTLLSRAEGGGHVASMEQVIAAIDELSGSPSWRRRSTTSLPGTITARARKRPVNTPMACLSLNCLEGKAEEHIQAAMDLGAGGATLSRALYLSRLDPAVDTVRELRESSDLILPEDLVNPILDALAFTGFFSPECGGIAEIGSVELQAAFQSSGSSSGRIY